jgi:hypothetical protein
MESALLVVAVVMSLNAVLQGLLYRRAAAAEAGGDPLWIAGIALPANICACAVLAWPWETSTSATLAMVMALTLGNAACLSIMRYRRIGEDVWRTASEERSSVHTATWFLGKAFANYTSQIALSTLAVTLPASSVTILSLASRLVGAITTTLTNAVMPVLVHRSTQTITAVKRFLRLLSGSLAFLGVAETAMVATLHTSYLPAAVVISLWIVASSAAAVAQRSAFRFLPARATGAVMAGILVVVASTTALAGVPGFNVIVLLCAYATLDAVAAALLLWSLKDRLASLVAVAGIAALVSVAAATMTR